MTTITITLDVKPHNCNHREGIDCGIRYDFLDTAKVLKKLSKDVAWGKHGGYGVDRIFDTQGDPIGTINVAPTPGELLKE